MHACAVALFVSGSALAQINVGIGDPPSPLTGEVYNPGIGVKLEDLKQDDVFYPININNWWGHMNQHGDIVIWPQFDWSDYEHDGMLRVVHGGRTGYINIAGNWWIKPTYEWADRFSESVTIFRDGGKYGMIDKSNKVLVPPRMDGALRFSEGFAAVQIGNRCGFIDRRGSVVVEPQFQRVRSFHDGIAMVQLPAAMLGYIDKRGKLVFRDDRNRFADLGDFYDGLARAKVGVKWGFIDKSFRLRIDAAWDEVDDFADGLAAVRQNGFIGYIDKAGTLVVPLRYKVGERFSEGLGMIEHDLRWGFVNRVGEERVALTYPWAEPYFRRYARVAMPPNFGYVGTNNNIVWDPMRPFDAIWDRTTGGLARIAVDLLDPPRVNGFVQRQTSLRLLPPPPRELYSTPYPPDYLYVDELPRRN